MAERDRKPLTPLTGLVQSVNDKGVKVDGEWRNFSKYATDLPEFEVGQRVTLLLDGDFVMGVGGGLSERTAAGGHAGGDAAPRRIAPDPSTDHGWSDGVVAGVAGVSRDVLIVRQSSLKAAVDLCAIVAQIDPAAAHSEAVLLVADKFVAWVLRPEGRAAPAGRN